MTNKPSLLEQHYRLIDGGGRDLDPATAAEKHRIDLIKLPKLELPARNVVPLKRPTHTVRNLILSGLAAAGIGAVWTARLNHSDDGLRTKGEHQVWVYWERAGDVKTYEAGMTLETGDRVRAEVLAAEGSVAYWGVTDASGRLLSDPDEVWGSALKLEPGERDVFSGSFKLVGPSEGETLVVILCEGEDLPRAVVDDLGKRNGRPLTAEALPSACGIKSFRLR